MRGEGSVTDAGVGAGASEKRDPRWITWASGFRAPYGLALSPTGELWEVEHGPRGGDELNLIEKGNNYGWPVARGGSRAISDALAAVID